MERLSNITRGIAATSILALAGVSALAQSTGEPQKRQAIPVQGGRQQDGRQEVPPRIMKQVEVIGAGVTNGQADDGRVVLGNISDLVIDGRTGEVRHVILASGGMLGLGKKQTAIVWSKVGFDTKQGFVLSLTAAELEKLPDFDQQKLSLLDKAAGDAASSPGGTAQSGDLKSDGKPVAAAAMPARSPLLLATQLASCSVVANKDELGSGALFLIEPKHGQVAFLSVPAAGGVGNASYIIPWQALKVVEPVGEDQQRQILVKKSKSELEAAPKLGEQGAHVNDARFRRKVYEFFGVDLPMFEAKKPQGKVDQRSADGGK